MISDSSFVLGLACLNVWVYIQVNKLEGLRAEIGVLDKNAHSVVSFVCTLQYLLILMVQKFLYVTLSLSCEDVCKHVLVACHKK